LRGPPSRDHGARLDDRGEATVRSQDGSTERALPPPAFAVTPRGR